MEQACNCGDDNNDDDVDEDNDETNDDGDDDEEKREMGEERRVECHEYSPYSRKYWARAGILGNTGGTHKARARALKSIKCSHTWTHFYDRASKP